MAAQLIDRGEPVAPVDEASFSRIKYRLHELLVNRFGGVTVDREVVFEVDLSHNCNGSRVLSVLGHYSESQFNENDKAKSGVQTESNKLTADTKNLPL